MSQQSYIPSTRDLLKTKAGEGPSSQEIKANNLSLAEKGFFHSFSLLTAEQKKEWVDKVIEGNQLPEHNPVKQGQKILEGMAQSRITTIFRIASLEYFMEEAKRLLAEEGVTPQERQLLERDITIAFTPRTEVASHLIPGDINIPLSPAGRRWSHEIEQRLNFPDARLSPEAYRIRKKALENCRHHMDVFDDALKEMGSATSRTTLQMMLGKLVTPDANPEMTFFLSWKSGKLVHRKPVIISAEDATAFADVLKVAWNNSLNEVAGAPLALSPDNVDAMCKAFASRVCQYDAKLAASQQPNKPEKVQAEDNHDYSTITLDNKSQQMLEALQSYSGTTAQNATRAAMLADIISSTQHVLSGTLDKNYSDIGKLILSPSNIFTAAKALGVDVPLSAISKNIAAESLKVNARQLGRLYQDSPGAIDSLMRDNNGLLLAALVMPRDELHNSITSYLTTHDKQIYYTQELKRRQDACAGRTDEEMVQADPKLERDRMAFHVLGMQEIVILQSIGDAVQKAMKGEKVKDVIPPLASIEKSASVVKPNGWSKEDHGRDFRFEPQPGGKKFILSSIEFPDTKRLLSYDMTADELTKATSLLRHECDMHRDHQSRMSEGEALTDPHPVVTTGVSPQVSAESNGKGRKAFAWQPAKGETIIVPDTAMLKKFTASRGVNGDTWLDFITATSKLPNVRIVIPEVVALEMQGKLPRYRNGMRTGGYEYLRPAYKDEGSVLHHDAKAFSHFIAASSYGKMQPDGTVMLSEGKNKNIIIMATPEDEELYQRIQQAFEPHNDVTLQNSVYHRGEGEKAIERFVRGVKFEAPIIVISDDLRYLDEVTRDPTKTGRTVHYIASGDYLNAEIAAGEDRISMLRQELGQPYASIDHVLESDGKRHIAKFNLDKDYTQLLHFIPSRGASGFKPMAATVQRGTKLLLQGVVKNGNYAASESVGWAENIEARRMADRQNGQSSSPT